MTTKIYKQILNNRAKLEVKQSKIMAAADKKCESIRAQKLVLDKILSELEKGLPASAADLVKKVINQNEEASQIKPAFLKGIKEPA